jgi:hypothetical protein
MRRILEPWIPKDDERLKALGAEGASVLRVAAAFRRRKGIVGARARNSAAPFRPCALSGKSRPTRRTTNGDINRPRLHIRARVNDRRHPNSSSSPEPDASSWRRRFNCSFGWCGRHRGHTRLNADSNGQAVAVAPVVIFAVSFRSPAPTENASRGPVERRCQSVSSASREQR